MEQNAHVVDQRGVRGFLEPNDRTGDRQHGRERPRIRLETGDTLHVAPERLTPDADGGYRYDGTFADHADDFTVEEHRLPLAREEVAVRRQSTDTARVRIHRRVDERTEQIDEPVVHEEIEVRHVPVGEVVDGPVPVRQEGEVTVIPILEERLVVRKELVLKEELHVYRRRTETRDERTVTLRSERAEVEREPLDDPPSSPPPGDPPHGGRDGRS